MIQDIISTLIAVGVASFFIFVFRKEVMGLIAALIGAPIGIGLAIIALELAK